MVEAKVAWRILEEERDRRQAGGIIREGSAEDEETKDETFDLPDTPSMYEWEDGISIEEVHFTDAEMEDEEAPAITELRAVVRELSQKLKLMAKASRLDALGSMDYLWKSISRLGRALELSNKSVRFVREELGDVAELHTEHRVYDVCEGVTLALASRPWEEELSALGARVSEVGKLLSEVDEDHQATGRLLLKKIGAAAPALSPGSGPTLSTSMTILDEQGNLVCSLGELLRDHRELRTEHRELKTAHLTMKADFDSLSAAVTAQGGQVLDGLGFASKAMVRILVMKECPGGCVRGFLGCHLSLLLRLDVLSRVGMGEVDEGQMGNQWWQESSWLPLRTQTAGMEWVEWMGGETRSRLQRQPLLRLHVVTSRTSCRCPANLPLWQ